MQSEKKRVQLIWDICPEELIGGEKTLEIKWVLDRFILDTWPQYNDSLMMVHIVSVCILGW